MHTRARSRSSGRYVPAMLVIFGVLAVSFGLFFTYLALDLLVFVDDVGADSGGLIDEEIAMPMKMLYEGGILSVIAGGAMTFLGCVLVVFTS